MVFGRDPWSQTPESWCHRKIHAERTRPDSTITLRLLLWVLWCPGELVAFYPGCMSPKWWTQEKAGRHCGPSPVPQPQLSAWCLTTSMVRNMCSETAGRPRPELANLIIRASLEKRWEHPSPCCSSNLEEHRESPQLNPRGRTCMWAKMGSCHSTVVIFSWCHLSWRWWNDHSWPITL